MPCCKAMPGLPCLCAQARTAASCAQPPPAAAEVHEYAEAALDGEGARVPRGCLLRRVPAGVGPGGAGFADALERAGFRADRLSVWALEVGY